MNIKLPNINGEIIHLIDSTSKRVLSYSHNPAQCLYNGLSLGLNIKCTYIGKIIINYIYTTKHQKPIHCLKIILS